MATPAQPPTERHVHFLPGQGSGSHRPLEAFRKKTVPSDSTTTVHSANNTSPQNKFFTIRTNVPFDRWFRDHRFHQPLGNKVELWQARGSAAIALGKGLGLSCIKSIQLLFAKIFYPSKADSFRQELSAQRQGVCLSKNAIVSPNQAKKKFLDYWDDPAHRAAIPNTFYSTRRLTPPTSGR